MNPDQCGDLNSLLSTIPIRTDRRHNMLLSETPSLSTFSVRRSLQLVLLSLLVNACSGYLWSGNRSTPDQNADSPPKVLNPSPILPSPEIPQETLSVQPSPTLTITSTNVPFFEGPIVIGYSVANRPLEVYRFGTGPMKRMLVAGIHGGYEWNTIALADLLITILRGRPDLIPQDVTLYILRALNPDGDLRAHGIYGRGNKNGVDLNRNWPAYWQAEWPLSGCWNLLPLSAGPSPASEPETQALMRFILSEHVEALLNYHSAALGIFPGGQPPDPASISLAEAVASVSDYPYPPIDTGCQFTGQLIDWASIHGIAAIDIELSTHTSTDLRQNLQILTTFLLWKR